MGISGKAVVDNALIIPEPKMESLIGYQAPRSV
jgi:hypothetical protein